MDKSQKIQPDGGAPRVAEISRITKETEIFVRLNLDGQGEASLDVPIGFMVHMLNTFARHGLFDLEVRAKGDLEVDQHHLVEDLGIVLGQCFSRALGDKRGIRRTGSCLYPMDETLARAAVDLSGRAFIVFEAALSGEAIVTEVGNADKEGGSPPPDSSPLARSFVTPPSGGDPRNAPLTPPAALFQTPTIEDFWQGFAGAAGCALHIDVLRGRSDHHKIEAIFKAAARALREAASPDPRAPGLLPSTKGLL